MGLTKIDLVMKFRQSAWLAPYFPEYQELRAEGQNHLETDFITLMTNAVFGKTRVNLKKHTEIKLLIDNTTVKKLVMMP